MPKVTKRQKCIETIADKINAYRGLHYGFKPKYIYMTEDLHKIITGRKTVKYEEEFCGVRVKLFHSDGLKFFLVQDVFEVKE
jgi:hypothetical protein